MNPEILFAETKIQNTAKSFNKRKISPDINLGNSNLFQFSTKSPSRPIEMYKKGSKNSSRTRNIVTSTQIRLKP
jgi:hypothetical protein